MVQWTPLSKAPLATRTFVSCSCALNNWSAMGRTGLGFHESPQLAIALMIRLGWDTGWANFYMKQSVIVACALSQVWSYQTLWARREVESGVGRFVSPPLSVKRLFLESDFRVKFQSLISVFWLFTCNMCVSTVLQLTHASVATVVCLWWQAWLKVQDRNLWVSTPFVYATRCIEGRPPKLKKKETNKPNTVFWCRHFVCIVQSLTVHCLVSFTTMVFLHDVIFSASLTYSGWILWNKISFYFPRTCGLRVGGWECSLVWIAPTLPPLAILHPWGALHRIYNVNVLVSLCFTCGWRTMVPNPAVLDDSFRPHCLWKGCFLRVIFVWNFSRWFQCFDFSLAHVCFNGFATYTRERSDCCLSLVASMTKVYGGTLFLFKKIWDGLIVMKVPIRCTWKSWSLFNWLQVWKYQ